MSSSSSSLSLYDLTVPILVRSLEQLHAFLKRGEQQWKEQSKDPQSLIDARIIDDMLPLPYQIQTVCNTAKNLLPRLVTGAEAQPVEDNEKTFAELYARIEATIKIVKAAEKDKFVEPNLTILVKSGKFSAEMEALHYVQRFCLPNFFFHLVTAYDILRKEGVEIGKMDFLGVGDLTSWTM